MSVKHALLALLANGAASTYALKRDFEATTGSSWPLNIGQVYTTLQRLERDGLVERTEPSPEDGQSEPFRITDGGRAELRSWWYTPLERLQPARSELVIKLAMAVVVPGVDRVRLIQAQRSATMRALHDFTRLKQDPPAQQASSAGSAESLVWFLMLENHIYTAEAELRWLDTIEAAILRHEAGSASAPLPTAAAAQAADRAAGRPDEVPAR